MPRTNLDTGLRELHSQILTLAWAVEAAFTSTLKALELGEHHHLPQIIEQNVSIDAMCEVAQQQALRLLILQQPLGGQDLRFLTAALYISDNYGRLGDAVVHMSRTLLQAASLYQQTVGPSRYSVDGNAVDPQGHLTDVFLLRGLLVLGQEIEHVLMRTREAFVQRDAVRARRIEAEQDFVELRYAPICRDIMQIQAQISVSSAYRADATFLQRITSLLWIAHTLAEMASYLSNTCKRIIFIVEG